MTSETDLIIEQVEGVTAVGFASPVVQGMLKIDRIGQQLLALTESPRPWIVVDLAGLKLISSLLLGKFVQIKVNAEKNGGDVVLSGIDPQLYRVFKVTALDQLFRFFPNRQEALNYYQSNLS